MKKLLISILLMVIITVSGNSTVLKREGWNLLSVCQDINSSAINLSGIKEIQNQEGDSLYTGEWAIYSNLETLYAGYGYWIKGNVGSEFDSRTSDGELIRPLLREGWNLMASCEERSTTDMNLTELNITEVQSQDGKTLYTGNFRDYSNLDTLLNGYGYWIKGKKNLLWRAKSGVAIPLGFDYQTINNQGITVGTTYQDMIIKLYVTYNEIANDQAMHTGIVVRVNGIDTPIVQIQNSYRGHEIVAAVYNSNGDLVAVSNVTTIAMDDAGTFIDIQIESSGSSDNNTSTGGEDTNVSNDYVLTAWNDLGMHCMDGNDFSVWSVLPPYNNLHAQLKDKKGGLVTSGVTLTYQATQGTDGQINSSSADKTNFWQFSNKLFPNSNLQANVGLTGNKTPSSTARALTYDTQAKWWAAEGIPIIPYNDDGTKNYYPLVKVTAKDTQGNTLAIAKVVLPVSDEMDCKRCHESNSLSPEAQPQQGWVFDNDPEKDFKYNVLRLHDERLPNAVQDHAEELTSKGYHYDNKGLEATARAGTPILCAACHRSNALPGLGVSGVKPFTAAMHGYHAQVVDPYTNLSMNSSKNRSACYACHPGAETKCLRGAMGDAVDSNGASTMQCQSCHGTMSQVGDTQREGWLDQPNCQACHHDGLQETSAIDPTTNTLRHAVDTRFATNVNTPMTGKSLYRISTGHGGLQCEACHGSPHAIYPAHEADNILSQTIQGHSGTVAECSACHAAVPITTTGGPHGMHTVGQTWVSRHQSVAENNAAQCKVCHGADYRGSALSKTSDARVLSIEGRTKNFAKGHQVSCYDCHNGPTGD